MLLFGSWPGIETRLLTVASYSVAAAIAVVRVARAIATDS